MIGINIDNVGSTYTDQAYNRIVQRFHPLTVGSPPASFMYTLSSSSYPPAHILQPISSWPYPPAHTLLVSIYSCPYPPPHIIQPISPSHILLATSSSPY